MPGETLKVEERIVWFVERENGERIAGPFTTRDDAWRARDWVEKAMKPETFWLKERTGGS